MPLPVEHASLLGELKEVRRAGLVRLRVLDLSVLKDVAAARTPDRTVEALLRLAVSRLDAGTLRTAAEYTLGLAPGTRDWPPADRRKRAAEVYGVSVERFRKDQELMVLGQIAEAVGRLAAGAGEAGGAGGTGSVARGGDATADGAWNSGTHRTLDVAVGGRELKVTVHVHPVDLLRDVDVIVSPVNTHLALPELYKSSIAASLRRAGAVRGVTGDVLADPVRDELGVWAARSGTSGRPVLPGTVVPTGSGGLADRGIRRIYHAAVAVPRAGTNDYDVLPADVTRATARAFALLADERTLFGPPLRSVCFPLLGSGRGGLPYAISVASVWAAVEAELARGARWDVHFVVRSPVAAALLDRLPARIRPVADRSATGGSG
ncbi:macro domain-containing protein [Streptomyces sp. NPDC087420]|uniref:macro domain-containing protein n=1 Tax=Streptomyces sp. NPDC087420 TaxID=3365785 RepID=UPI0038380781